MLLTRWGKNLSETPLSEYPRPQFVRESYLSLNGKWGLAFSKEKSINRNFEFEIIVPFSPEAPLSKVGRTLENDEYLIYKKVFEIEKGFNKGRVFINFGAVDQIAEVYLNGSFIGCHHGGYTPFSFEITDFIKQGENILNVIAEDKCEENEYSRGKQKTNRGGIWYTKQSGIWQSVWLESTPKEYIKSFRITPDFDNEQVSFEFENAEGVEILIYDGGELIADTTDKTIKIPNFKAWSPESPFLYDVVFKFGKDRVKSYFGMRKFSVGNDENGIPRLFLNNEPYFHNGLLDQGYYPDGFLTPPSNEALENDVKTMKECGFNMLRKHIKIEPLLWYHYCDKHGIIVWQDMINGGGKYGLEVSAIPFLNINLNDSDYKRFSRTNEEARALYYKELKEMIDALYNCPCIAMWVPFNEGWGQFDSNKAYEIIKQWDKTRLVDSASGWHDQGESDVISKHIYFTPIKVKAGERPWVLSEFGGYGYKLEGHTFSDKMFGYRIYKSEKSLTKAYKKLYEKVIIPQIKTGLSGTVYTEVSDVEDELNGLMTYDREVLKIDKEVLQEINSRVHY
ncbi:MAG: glycoside hydrolase family 2 [Ruminococcaceae bacterium]|nr:glycoside hydrolase family 2 [Oscillospiraceae bacterium]